MTPDSEAYAAILDDARRWLKAEAGVAVDPDDPSLLSAAIALQAIRMQDGKFEAVSRQAVERASDPIRETMERQIAILQRIAGNFEEASSEARQITSARDTLVSVMAKLGTEIQQLQSGMVLTRHALEQQRGAKPLSPALLTVSGFALFVTGCAAGLMIAQRML